MFPQANVSLISDYTKVGSSWCSGQGSSYCCVLVAVQGTQGTGTDIEVLEAAQISRT